MQVNRITEIDKELNLLRCHRCKGEAEIEDIYAEYRPGRQQKVYKWCGECWSRNHSILFCKSRYYKKIGEPISFKFMLDNGHLSFRDILLFVIGINTVRNDKIKKRFLHPIFISVFFVSLIPILLIDGFAATKQYIKYYFKNYAVWI